MSRISTPRITKLRKRTQRIADQNMASARKVARSGRKVAKSGWNDLTGALGGVADRSQNLAGSTRSRLAGFEREGVRRTKAAKDALAGRRPKGRVWVAGAAAIGVGIGAAVTVLARKLSVAREHWQAERAATVVADELRKQDLRNEMEAAAAGHEESTPDTRSSTTAEPATKAELNGTGPDSRESLVANAKPASTAAATGVTPAAGAADGAAGPTSQSDRAAKPAPQTENAATPTSLSDGAVPSAAQLDGAAKKAPRSRKPQK